MPGPRIRSRARRIPSDKPNFFVYTRREPVGVVGAIVPWNSPLLLLSFKLAPALAAGCTVVIKPAEQTPASILEFAKLFEEADFPPGVVNVITGFGEGTGRPLVRHPGVDKVAFTGSTETGIGVMKDAADHLARVSLELGGKSPNIVFDDADLRPRTTAGLRHLRGQRARPASRSRGFSSKSGRMTSWWRGSRRRRDHQARQPAGDGDRDGSCRLRGAAPTGAGLHRATGRKRAPSWVYGGRRPQTEELRDGYFIEPTIFAGVSNDMRVAREEIFGPVLSVIPFESEDDLIRQANDTRYGLAAGIWTRDIQKAHRVAHALRAGTVWVNSYRTLSFNTPFGGYKMSGMGRENGLESLKDYTQVKSVWVELSADRDPFTPVTGKPGEHFSGFPTAL